MSTSRTPTPTNIGWPSSFDSKESYFANAASPEQHASYRRLRELLTDDPEWHDGEVVTAFFAI
jgi:hypothetical protein